MYFISDGLSQALNFIAVQLHLGYLVSLIILSVFMKLTTIPNKMIGFNNKKRKNIVKERLNELRRKKDMKKNVTWVRRRIFRIRIKQIYKEQKIISIKKRTLLVLAQLFVTIQFIHMITRINPINGHIANVWFNLAEKDVTFILPIVVLILNSIEGYPESTNSDLKDFIIYAVINLLIFIFALHMPSAVVIYWVVTTILSILVNIILFEKNAFKNLPFVRKKIIVQKDYYPKKTG